MSPPFVHRRTILKGGLAAAAAAAAAPFNAGAFAQQWPSRSLKILIGFPPGGSPDVVARLVADKLSPRLGQPVVVESVVGAGGVIASERVAKADPDGSLMVMLTGAHSGTAATRKSLPYDPVRDFSFVSTVTAYPMMVVAPLDSPIKTLPDLLQRAKAAPGQITYASNAPGSLHHLLGEWINIEAGTVMVPVPYRGAAQALVDLLGGRVDVMIDTATTAVEQVRGGKVRALAVASPSRYPLLPDAPTVAETLPGVETMSWLGLAMAPGTPRSIVDRLNVELQAILATAEMKERFAQLGGVPSPSTPEVMREQISREIERWNRVVEQKSIERQ